MEKFPYYIKIQHQGSQKKNTRVNTNYYWKVLLMTKYVGIHMKNIILIPNRGPIMGSNISFHWFAA